jgi:hypothetical protein
VTSARLIVAPPDFTPTPYGLSSVVEWREGDPHWQAGVEWQTVCGDASTTFDECVLNNAVTGTGIAEPVPKEGNSTLRTFGATPFTVFSQVDCSAVGFYEDSAEWAEQTLLRNEMFEVERAFWTGSAGVANDVVYPHLAADTELVDAEAGASEVTLQQAVTVVTGAAACVQVALGLLEEAFADCYRGTGIIHVPAAVLPQLVEAFLVEDVDGVLRTRYGSAVVVSGGYTGSGPDGGEAVGVRWIYMTPPIFGYRSGIRTFERVTTLDRSVNNVMAIAERNYLLGYDCCLFGIPVALTCD